MTEQAEHLQQGATKEIRHVVTHADTALAHRSGEVAVLGTPKVLALVEEATMAVIGGALGPSQTSVGMRVQLDHVQPTAVGATVTAQATLERIDGRRLNFSVNVREGDDLVAEGRVVRVLVETERFLARAQR